jgi:hypothetical protein
MGQGDATIWVGLLFGALALSYLGIKNKNILLGIIAAVLWLFFWTYEKSNLPTGIVLGSAGQNFITVVCLGMVIALPIICIVFWRGEKKYNERDESEYQFKQTGRKSQPTYSDVTSTSNSVNLQDMSDAEYLRLLQNQSRKNKR